MDGVGTYVWSNKEFEETMVMMADAIWLFAEMFGKDPEFATMFVSVLINEHFINNRKGKIIYV